MSEPSTIIVPLTRPIYIGGDQTCRRVVLREPCMREYARLGEPVVFVPDVNGHDVPVEMDEVIS
jgi:hypothetical protein